jgi:hypothetical protein
MTLHACISSDPSPFKTMKPIYQSTRSHMAEELRFQQHRCEHLKYCILITAGRTYKRRSYLLHNLLYSSVTSSFLRSAIVLSARARTHTHTHTHTQRGAITLFCVPSRRTWTAKQKTTFLNHMTARILRIYVIPKMRNSAFCDETLPLVSAVPEFRTIREVSLLHNSENLSPLHLPCEDLEPPITLNHFVKKFFILYR